MGVIREGVIPRRDQPDYPALSRQLALDPGA